MSSKKGMSMLSRNHDLYLCSIFHFDAFAFTQAVKRTSDLEFYNTVAQWPGSVHDSRIFYNSHVPVLYEENTVPGELLGDAGYACQPFLMTSLVDPGSAKHGSRQASDWHGDVNVCRLKAFLHCTNNWP